jgi:hypothetical protein
MWVDSSNKSSRPALRHLTEDVSVNQFISTVMTYLLYTRRDKATMELIRGPNGTVDFNITDSIYERLEFLKGQLKYYTDPRNVKEEEKEEELHTEFQVSNYSVLLSWLRVCDGHIHKIHEALVTEDFVRIQHLLEMNKDMSRQLYNRYRSKLEATMLAKTEFINHRCSKNFQLYLRHLKSANRWNEQLGHQKQRVRKYNNLKKNELIKQNQELIRILGLQPENYFSQLIKSKIYPWSGFMFAKPNFNPTGLSWIPPVQLQQFSPTTNISVAEAKNDLAEKGFPVHELERLSEHADVEKYLEEHPKRRPPVLEQPVQQYPEVLDIISEANQDPFSAYTSLGNVSIEKYRRQLLKGRPSDEVRKALDRRTRGKGREWVERWREEDAQNITKHRKLRVVN